MASKCIFTSPIICTRHVLLQKIWFLIRHTNFYTTLLLKGESWIAAVIPVPYVVSGKRLSQWVVQQDDLVLGYQHRQREEMSAGEEASELH